MGSCFEPFELRWGRWCAGIDGILIEKSFLIYFVIL